MISERAFMRICRFMKDGYGVDLTNKREIVNGRLENYVLRVGGWADYDAYMDEVESDPSGVLKKTLVDILTTNHTYFMRETEHFDYMKQVVLPYLRKKEERKKDLCIWCAASSTGEEPYTIAMVLQDFFGLEYNDWDTTVLATDVSTRVLETAAKGVYTAEQVRTLPPAWRRRFFRSSPDGSTYEATRELKAGVLFRPFNLMEDFPFKRRMHVIFLRNVMIYFDDRTKRELIRKVYDVMEPGGYLFIGQTETLNQERFRFQMIKPSIFRK